MITSKIKKIRMNWDRFLAEEVLFAAGADVSVPAGEDVIDAEGD